MEAAQQWLSTIHLLHTDFTFIILLTIEIKQQALKKTRLILMWYLFMRRADQDYNTIVWEW